MAQDLRVTLVLWSAINGHHFVCRCGQPYQISRRRLVPRLCLCRAQWRAAVMPGPWLCRRMFAGRGDNR